MKRKSTKGTSKEEKKQPVPKKYAVPVKEQGIMRTSGYYGRYNYSMGPQSIEKKWVDLTVASTVVPTGGSIALFTTAGSLNVIAQGTGESQRVGRKVNIKNLYLHGTLLLPSSNLITSSCDTFRLIVFIDKQCNGLIAQVTDILTTAEVNSFRNLANQERFIILKDKMYDINATTVVNATTTTGDQQYHIKMYKKLDLPIEYSGVNGTIGETKSNCLVMLCISEGGVVGFKYTMRLNH